MQLDESLDGSKSPGIYLQRDRNLSILDLFAVSTLEVLCLMNFQGAGKKVTYQPPYKSFKSGSSFPFIDLIIPVENLELYHTVVLK